MSSLTQRMMKASKLESSTITDSKLVNKEKITTDVYSINLAMSGELKGGFTSGITMLAGESKTFKSLLGLMMCRAFLDKHEDGIVLFYDSEFGITQDYLESNGIDADRMIQIPIKNIEELKFDAMAKLDELSREDKVMIFIDSIGNLASKKEVEDALDSKSVADMTRARTLKSFFRIVTPYMTMLDIPMVVVNHVYDSMDAYSGPVVGGGKGGIYSSDNIFIVGKRKIKDGKEILGHTFVLNAEKSRTIKEKSAIPFDVLYEGGIDKYSGLLDIALATDWVEKPKMGWFTRTTVENDKNWRRKETSCDEFWEPLLADQEFLDTIAKMYKLGSGGLFNEKLAQALNSDLTAEDADEE